MRVFVTGATGFIGSAVVRELLDAGHEVVGLARSDASAEALRAAGAAAHPGDLTDPDALRAAAGGADGAIHTAFVHDFSPAGRAAAMEVDRAAIAAMGEAFAGSDRPLVVTSGTAGLSLGRPATEDDVPADPAAGRHPAEQLTLALAERGVRSSVLRLPPSVHGEGDLHGFVPQLVAIAREAESSATVGDGANRWAAVHRLDAARLFRLALEGAPASSRLHGVAEEGVPAHAMAAAIGRQLGVPVTSVSPEEAADRFTWLAPFWAMDVPASSAHTRTLLGWDPVGPTLLADLDAGHYLPTAPVP
jgi:nucleoside-diphosphate-sugar epimerase